MGEAAGVGRSGGALARALRGGQAGQTSRASASFPRAGPPCPHASHGRVRVGMYGHTRRRMQTLPPVTPSHTSDPYAGKELLAAGAGGLLLWVALLQELPGCEDGQERICGSA